MGEVKKWVDLVVNSPICAYSRPLRLRERIQLYSQPCVELNGPNLYREEIETAFQINCLSIDHAEPLALDRR